MRAAEDERRRLDRGETVEPNADAYVGRMLQVASMGSGITWADEVPKDPSGKKPRRRR